MTLPKMMTPKFDTLLPSTQQKITYRPFLVKEEKLLLMAAESDDQADMERAIIDILHSCVLTEGVDYNALTSYDLEYLFLQLRAKSVGEKTSLYLSHDKEKDCKEKTEVEIDLTKVEVQFNEEHVHDIKLDDNIGIKLKDPSIFDLTQLKNEEIETKDVIDVLSNCIELVYDKEDIYEDFTKEEAIEFLSNLTQPQYVKLQTFLTSIPQLVYNAKWTCKACGETDELKIRGIQDFF
jgi:hypothetical protein